MKVLMALWNSVENDLFDVSNLAKSLGRQLYVQKAAFWYGFKVTLGHGCLCAFICQVLRNLLHSSHHNSLAQTVSYLPEMSPRRIFGLLTRARVCRGIRLTPLGAHRRESVCHAVRSHLIQALGMSRSG